MPGGVSGVTVSATSSPTVSTISWFGPPSTATTIAAVLAQVQTYLTSSIIGSHQGSLGREQVKVLVGATGGAFPVLTADATTQRNTLCATLGYY